MVKMLFTKDRRETVETEDFNQVWQELSKFRESEGAGEAPDFIGLQDEDGRMVLITLYDEDRWVLEALEEDWGAQFGRIDLAEDFKVQEILLTDVELKNAVRKFMTEGRLK